MSNHTNTAFSLLGSTPEQRRYRAVSLSREYVDAEFDKIAAQLQTEQTLQANNVVETRSRQAEQAVYRNDLERIFNPQPTKEEVARMMEEISIYLMQEGALLDNYREQVSGAK